MTTSCDVFCKQGTTDRDHLWPCSFCFPYPLSLSPHSAIHLYLALILSLNYFSLFIFWVIIAGFSFDNFLSWCLTLLTWRPDESSSELWSHYRPSWYHFTSNLGCSSVHSRSLPYDLELHVRRHRLSSICHGRFNSHHIITLSLLITSSFHSFVFLSSHLLHLSRTLPTSPAITVFLYTFPSCLTPQFTFFLISQLLSFPRTRRFFSLVTTIFIYSPTSYFIIFSHTPPSIFHNIADSSSHNDLSNSFAVHHPSPTSRSPFFFHDSNSVIFVFFSWIVPHSYSHVSTLIATRLYLSW